MISTKDFNDLLAYLKNRPSECQRLLTILLGEHFVFEKAEASAVADTSPWLTAREVGRKVGMSSRWVRDHSEGLPTTSKRQQYAGRRCWHYLWNDNTRQWFNQQLTI